MYLLFKHCKAQGKNMSKAVMGKKVPISCHQGCLEPYLKITLSFQSPRKLDKILG